MRDRVRLVPAIQPLEQRLERCHGVAELAFASAGEGRGAALRHLYQKTPCRVLFPRIEAGDLPTAVLLTTSGGLTGGDSIALSVEALPGAAATVTTQAAEKIYRALAGDVAITLSLRVGAGAWVEWLPQETILFEGARLARRSEAVVAPGGRLMAGEMLVFGRRARGERFARGRLHDAWRLRRGTELVWADALHFEGEVGRLIAHPAGGDGAAALALLLYVADDAASWLEPARDILAGSSCRAAATVVNGVLLARLIGREAQSVREGLAHLAASLRAAIAGLPARLPRVWAT
jgi:urease accessory protein